MPGGEVWLLISRDIRLIASAITVFVACASSWSHWFARWGSLSSARAEAELSELSKEDEDEDDDEGGDDVTVEDEDNDDDKDGGVVEEEGSPPASRTISNGEQGLLNRPENRHSLGCVLNNLC